jgi:hypothetical protein
MQEQSTRIKQQTTSGFPMFSTLHLADLSFPTLYFISGANIISPSSQKKEYLACL